MRVPTSNNSNSLRSLLETFSSRLSLPITRKALGILEGEHGSTTSGRGYDFMDLRTYQPGDEAQLIDWKASARSGVPIIVNKEREVSSKIWLLLDTSAPMLASARGGERLIDVAANGLRMVAMLSLKRSDEVSLVLGNVSAITRLRFSGEYSKFDHLVDSTLEQRTTADRNLESLLDYALRIKQKKTLLVIATDDSIMNPKYEIHLRLLARTHPLMIIGAKPFDPFCPHVSALDASTALKIPAFLRSYGSKEKDREKKEAATYTKNLKNFGVTVFTVGSSQELLTDFTRLISTASQTTGRPNSLITSLLPKATSTVL